jgi:hypothetical protein
MANTISNLAVAESDRPSVHHLGLSAIGTHAIEWHQQRRAGLAAAVITANPMGGVVPLGVYRRATNTVLLPVHH